MLVLAIINISNNVFEEERSLKASMKVTSSQDVKWSSSSEAMLATAATNGSIVLWDVHRMKPLRTIHEHERAVNKLSFSRVDHSILLSCSQDGTCKLWDIRAMQNAKSTFRGYCESARDVQAHPLNSFQFIAAFETGDIQVE